jgi:hypothetical protein
MHRRAWDGVEWESFALRIVQRRHGAQNVQVVPDRVRGDAGLEFITTDGCAYQCYAPEETANVAKASSAIKAKASRDLNKLVENEQTIARLLQEMKISRWILLCPFVDDKEVVAFVRQRGAELRNAGLSILAVDFEALVQSQVDFEEEVGLVRLEALGFPVRATEPTPVDVESIAGSQLTEQLLEKLRRGFPDADEAQIEGKKHEHVRAYMLRENTLDEMRQNYPVLWEKAMRALKAEEQRLVTIGASAGLPREQLASSLERIEASLRADLSLIEVSVITNISVGTLGDWLIRCPLDFIRKS